MRRLAPLLALLFVAPLCAAQPVATTTALGPLAVEIDGESVALEPQRAAARDDGFVVLAKKAEASFDDDPLVVLTLGASGAVTGHRVLGLGNVLGAPTRIQPYGSELLFAVNINETGLVKVVALDGLEHRVVASTSSGAASNTETTGSPSFGMTTTTTTQSLALTDAVPLAQDLFLVTGQSTLSVRRTTAETMATGNLGPATSDSAPEAVLVNTAGETRRLEIPDLGYGRVEGAAMGSGEFAVVYWTGTENGGDITVGTFGAGFEPGDSFGLGRPAGSFRAAYPWGEGFLLYGVRGADPGGPRTRARPDSDSPARLTLTIVGGRPASGARGGQEVEIGQDFPRNGGRVSFLPAFLGTLEGHGVVAVARVSPVDEEGVARRWRAYLGAPKDGPETRWEMAVGTEAARLEPLALHPSGALLTAHQEGYREPWHLELVTLTE